LRQVNPDPLAGPTEILAEGTFVPDGPHDIGALFDLDLGVLPGGQTLQFTMYYGAAGTEAPAMSALSAVGAQVYSTAIPNFTGQPGDGSPNTFMFGITGLPSAPQGGQSFASGGGSSTDGGLAAGQETTIDTTDRNTGAHDDLA
jgi:hypothetical protein